MRASFSAGSPDAPGVEASFRRVGKQAGMTRDAFAASLVKRTLLKRLPRLADVATMAALAALVASDYASAVSGVLAKVACGVVVDP
jgi:hypothetical protein